MTVLNSDFIDFFFIFNVNSPGAEADNPRGQNFCANTKTFVTAIIFVKFHHDTPNSKEISGHKTFFLR